MAKATLELACARVDKDALFKMVGYQPHPGQVPLHRSTARFRILACGVRFGKSMAAAMEVVAALLQPAEQARGWIVAPSKDLVDRIFERVVAVFQERLAHRIVESDERQQRLVVRNLGAGLTEVRGKSAQDAVSLLGEALDFVVIDEAARLPRSIWESHLSARLVDRRGWALLVSTPNRGNWFMKLFRRGQRGRDADTESWQFPSFANPFLDAELVEEERRRLPLAAFEEQYMARFVDAPPEPCGRCGGPSPELPYASVVVTDQELETCEECGKPVDPEGKTLVRLWPNGRTTSKVVLLRPMVEGAE